MIILATPKFCKRGHGVGVYANGKTKLCLECTRLRQRKWEEKHKERLRELSRIRAKRYREKYPERVAASRKKCRQNSEKQKIAAVERTNKWRANNKAAFLAQRRDYYARNKERLKQYWNQLYLANRSRVLATSRERYRRNHPGAQIRGIASRLASGGLNIDEALKEIRQHFDRVNGLCFEATGAQRDGSRGDGESALINGTDPGQFI